MKLTRKANIKMLYIWLFWINVVAKECLIVHTARVAYIVREHIPELLFLSYLQYINELLKMKIETLSSFPQEAFK